MVEHSYGGVERTAFEEALRRTKQYEGGEVNDPRDPGGHTYCGISRRFWPEWEGWKYVDMAHLSTVTENFLHRLVYDFYRVNFWHKVRGSEVARLSLEVACEIFDTAVNIDPVDAVRLLQGALNKQNGFATDFDDLLVDGLFGDKTMDALALYMSWQPRENNEKILLNCLNGEQYKFYEANPQHEYFRGWFLRC